jgi:hypothetical protein
MSNGIVAKITAAYERDQKRDAAAIAGTDLPLSYESITSQWLTRVLCKAVPDAQVASFSLGPPDDGSSNRRTIQVQYNHSGEVAGLPTALFCKATHDLANRIVLGVSGGARGEALFYRDIRPLLNIESPRCYYAHFDEQTFNSIIMLGDVSKEVTEFCTDRTPMSRARAESQIHLLTELHGRIYGDARLQESIAQIPTWPGFFHGTLAFGMKEGSSKGFLSAESVIPTRVYRQFDKIWPATLAAVAMHEVLPHTLAHGDVHLKNWYVAGNGEMGLADWQCCGRGHWSRDVAYTISTALTTDDRRSWEQDLLRLYLEGMHSAGGPRIEFNDAWLAYRQQLISALTWWTVTLTPPEGLPDMQPKNTTLEFIRRIATAIDDLDSLAAFT